MNKKTLFLVLLADFLLLATYVSAAQSEACRIIDSVKNILATTGVTIVVIGWVIAGILWLISGGSPEKTGTAKKAIWAAAIGTALIVLSSFAYVIIADFLGYKGTASGCS